LGNGSGGATCEHATNICQKKFKGKCAFLGNSAAEKVRKRGRGGDYKQAARETGGTEEARKGRQKAATRAKCTRETKKRRKIEFYRSPSS